jgi:outer membrane protein assembly factor BamB
MELSHRRNASTAPRPAVAADGTVYVGSNDGRFYAINADGATKWSFGVPASASASNSPAVAADGTI